MSTPKKPYQAPTVEDAGTVATVTAGGFNGDSDFLFGNNSGLLVPAGS
ncbi:MAG: lasso RiPP family leader peptide-containing protein [Bacteroidota bacterium]